MAARWTWILVVVGSACRFGGEIGSGFQCEDTDQCPSGQVCTGGSCTEVPDGAEIDPDGGDPPTTGCGAISLLQDDFGGASISTEWWTFDDVGVTLSVGGGELQIDVTAGTNDNLGGLTSRTAFDLTGAAFDVEVVQVGAHLTIVEVRDDVSGGRMQTVVEDGTLYAGVFNVPNPGTRIEIPYLPAEHRFWRIREEDGDAIWELSGDRTSWAELHREPMPFGAAHVRGVVAGGDDLSGAASEIRFGDVNLSAPSDQVYCPAGSLRDDFGAPPIGPLWEPYDDPPGCTLGVSGGALVMSFESDDDSAFCGIESVHNYDLRESSFVIDAGEIPSSAVAFVTYIEASKFDDFETYLGFALESDTLHTEQYVEGISAGDSQLAYDRDEHRYWRLRGAGGRVYLEVSPDLASWEALFDEPAAFDLSRVLLAIGAGYYDATPSVPLEVSIPAVDP